MPKAKKTIDPMKIEAVEIDKILAYSKNAKKHPTMKPVELVVEAITNSSEPGDAVLDTFLGSGTTLIACEKTGRKCFGVELDPKYADVIVERWEKYTGKKAVLIRNKK